jgi:hypothetical protein
MRMLLAHAPEHLNGSAVPHGRLVCDEPQIVVDSGKQQFRLLVRSYLTVESQSVKEIKRQAGYLRPTRPYSATENPASASGTNGI